MARQDSPRHGRWRTRRLQSAAVHRIASRIDDQYELVAGCFSSTPEKSKASGADLGLPEDRVYGDFEEMAKREARLKNGIEAVAIVTPNYVQLRRSQAVPEARHPRDLRQSR